MATTISGTQVAQILEVENEEVTPNRSGAPKRKRPESSKNKMNLSMFDGAKHGFCGKRGIVTKWQKEWRAAEDTHTWIDDKGNLQMVRKGNMKKNQRFGPKAK